MEKYKSFLLKKKNIMNSFFREKKIEMCTSAHRIYSDQAETELCVLMFTETNLYPIKIGKNKAGFLIVSIIPQNFGFGNKN